jgi:8-oxo-dGTP pyrophosphatase MutT (NUDIX family)
MFENRTTRYQAAIIQDDALLLLRVIDYLDGRMFWVIPGGGIEEGETEEACVQREAFEETCLRVEVEGLILEDAEIGGIYQRRKTYHCRVVGGDANAGCEPEVDTPTFASIQEVRWFDLHAPHTWDALMVGDHITFPQVQRIRAALGYDMETEGTPSST